MTHDLAASQRETVHYIVASATSDRLFSDNNFTILRWILALSVVTGHAFMVVNEYEPIRLHDWTLSYLAVNAFFILSGLLIAKSLSTRECLFHFLVARTLRVLPGLLFVLLGLMLVFGPLFGDPNGLAFLSQSEPWEYVISTLLMGDTLGAPGNVFNNNPEDLFNGSLWTIRYEMLAYALAAVGYFSGVLKGRWAVLTALIISQAIYWGIKSPDIGNVVSGGIESLFRFTTVFLMGMTLWHFPILRKMGWAALTLSIALFLLVGSQWIGETFANIALTAFLTTVGLNTPVSKRFSKIPDYSYGIYIWHYPLLQSAFTLFPDTSPIENFAIALPVTLLVAAISWCFVEKPSLRTVNWVSRQFKVSTRAIRPPRLFLRAKRELLNS